MQRSAILLSFVIFGLVGCSANYNSIFRTAENDKPQTILIDAKQRAIISNKLKEQLVICAEKSPDVFSVLSSAGSGSAAYKAVEVQGSYSSSESGASIGLRTQLTQAQSEYLYYLCQLYASGSISKASVETEIRRFPTTIVALLAIEQLTGYAKPNFVAIGGQGAAGKAENLGGMQRAVDLARSDDQQKQAVEADAAKKVADAEKVLEEKNTAKTKLLASVDTTQADKDITTATTALKAAQDKKTTDEKAVADDATAVAAAEKVLEEKKTAKKNLPPGADTTEADKAIAAAQTALTAAQDKQTADKKAVADDATAVAAAEKTLAEKNTAKDKLLASVDTTQAVKDITKAEADLKAAKDNKKVTGDAAKDSASNLKQIEAARDAAANALSASTSSTQAQFLDAKGSSYYVADSQSVQAVATAVTNIVNTVTTQTFTTEMCLKAFFENDAEQRRQFIASVDTTQAAQDIKDIAAAQTALKAAQDKQTADKKVVADDATAVMAAEKTLEDKKAARKNLLSGADPTQADKAIIDATTALKAAQDKQTADKKAVADDATAVAEAEKTLGDKKADLNNLLTDANLASFCINWMNDITRWRFQNLYLTYGMMADGITPNPAVNRAVVPPTGSGPGSQPGAVPYRAVVPPKIGSGPGSQPGTIPYVVDNTR